MPRHAAFAFARALDLLIAGAILVATAPVLALTALALWFEGPGPILVGGGRLRFRTMWMDENGRAVGRGELGQWLWVTRVEELPQFISLLKGDVSLFGAGAPALSLEA
ncbi:MAG: sugar transferase [Alphaproteobacteria bacterium]